MRPRLNINVALGIALLAACAALYAWSPAVALLSLGFALAGFAAARLLRPAGSTDGAARSLDSTRPPEAATPNVAAAVASGEVPAAALLDVTMDSMREAVVVIDSAMRVVALNNSARDVFRSEGASALSPRRLSDLTRNPAIYSAFAAAVARGERAEVKVETERAGERRLSSLVSECFTALAARAEERRVALVNEVPPGVFVHADARRLEQMLTNLVDNAVKFSREGGEVRVSHEREGARDRVRVADTGEGIASEHLPRIFERFYRVDRARSRAMGGTGLGLAIVKHLARAHGGEASVRSTPGQGSTFTVELPVGPES